MRNQPNHETLPEKKAGIEKLVTIPEDIEKVLNGTKSATRRNGVYADVGEVMSLKGHRFTVERIYSQYLGDMTDEDAQQEGYSDLASYQTAILKLHPGMRWVPKMKVWVHEYAPSEAND